MKHYLGMDVSKAKLDCSLLQDVSGAKRKVKNGIANNRAGIDALLVWCEKQGVTPDCLHVIMEGTGVYHEQAASRFAMQASLSLSSIRHKSGTLPGGLRC